MKYRNSIRPPWFLRLWRALIDFPEDTNVCSGKEPDHQTHGIRLFALRQTNEEITVEVESSSGTFTSGSAFPKETVFMDGAR